MSRRHKVASFELVDIPLIQKDGADRKADDHVDGHGDSRRNRRSSKDRPEGGRDADRAAEMYERVSGAARRR